MIGKYSIEIYNNKLHYFLEVKRNITIIQGNSATGKTTLVNLVANYERLGTGSGITLICERDCVVLPVVMWQEYIKNASQKIIFVDENMPFLRSKEFAEAVNHSDNYFVIIYRDSLPALAYSIEEIYGIREDRESQKYANVKQVYESMYRIYNLDHEAVIRPDIVVTEDANSGHEFFESLFKCECVSGEGKTKMHNAMIKNSGGDKTVLGIVDGAAFGADIQKMMRSISSKKDKCVLFAPESFEYLLLKSGVIPCDEKELNETYDYADSSLYESWEQFYTDKLHEYTQNTDHQYTKKNLNKFYLSDKCKNSVKKIMHKIDTE